MVYYLGYYDCEQISKECRKAAPPAINKMGYMISTLSKASLEKVIVVNPAETILNKYTKGNISNINENISIKTFDSINSKNKFVRVFGHFLTKLNLIAFLLKNVKKEDTLIVYHSLALLRTVKMIKKLKKSKLIIEVEELYSDVREDLRLRKKEIKYFQIADKYIVITEMLNEMINVQNKPALIFHGTYKTIPKCSEKFSDGKKHVVYAGSFSKIKGGAYSAIESAEFLNEDYVLHILGRDDVDNNRSVLSKIEWVSQKTKCEIVYDGYKKGKEFDAFIQSCHIGLSTQQPDGKYNDSSFPSKILMYMSNGLPVVSIGIPAVKTSLVGKYIYYYDRPSSKNIADAIKAVPEYDDFEIRNKLTELDQKFTMELSQFLR